jgi:hypothetical protein
VPESIFDIPVLFSRDHLAFLPPEYLSSTPVFSLASKLSISFVFVWYGNLIIIDDKENDNSAILAYHHLRVQLTQCKFFLSLVKYYI